MVLLLGSLSGCIGDISRNAILTHTFSEPLGSTTTAKADISTHTGNLTVDKLVDSEDVLASGTLQYVKKFGSPTRSLSTINDRATFKLRPSDKSQPWYHFPWKIFDAAIEWQVHFNPAVPWDLGLYSGGGHIKMDLAGMSITNVSAETSGGNVFISLPDNAANLSVVAKSGGGNVTVEVGSGLSGNNTLNAQSGGGKVIVHLPEGIAARIIATSGAGKVVVDSRFIKLDEKTFQSPEFEEAADKVEITLTSGAGSVMVDTK